MVLNKIYTMHVFEDDYQSLYKTFYRTESSRSESDRSTLIYLIKKWEYHKEACFL